LKKFGQNADGRQGVNIIHSLSAIILKTYLWYCKISTNMKNI